jgi:hypothetical protein
MTGHEIEVERFIALAAEACVSRQRDLLVGGDETDNELFT